MFGNLEGIYASNQTLKGFATHKKAVLETPSGLGHVKPPSVCAAGFEGRKTLECLGIVKILCFESIAEGFCHAQKDPEQIALAELLSFKDAS